MKQEKITKNDVIVLIALGVVLLALVCAALGITGAVRKNAAGIWHCKLGYSAEMQLSSSRALHLNRDGTYVAILTNTYTGQVLETESGTWKATLTTVKCTPTDSTEVQVYSYDLSMGDLTHKYEADGEKVEKTYEKE